MRQTFRIEVELMVKLNGKLDASDIRKDLSLDVGYIDFDWFDFNVISVDEVEP